jgi:hypothetical protein
MSWMAELSSYRYLGELKRRYRGTDLDPADRPAAESSPANGPTDAAAAPASTLDDERSTEPAASVTDSR